MGLIAYQLVDFNNPISVEHSQHSINSFKPVRDVLTIIPVQCTTPSTLPTDKFYGDSKERTVYEQSCFCSHYHLVKRLSSGEHFFIMEHDAYLWPQDEDRFRALLLNYHTYSVYYLGIANEFYYLAQNMAKVYIEKFDQGKIFRGPMSHVRWVYDKFVRDDNSKVLWPVSGQINKLCSSNAITSAASGIGVVYRAPVTQHFKLSVGSTIIERKNKWIFNKQNNPDMYFTE